MADPARSRIPDDLPHLTLAGLGHAGHGKTTLLAAIRHVLAASGGHGPPRPYPEPGYTTGTRRYTHLDPSGAPGAAARVPAVASRLDGAVLVVSSLDGVRPQTVEHVALARGMGVEHLVVALTKAESAVDELSALVELDVRALLDAHGFAGHTLPVVRVSAARALRDDARWRGTVEALLDAVDTYVPLPARDFTGPFLLPVHRAVPAPGGVWAVGTVERGTVRVGDRLCARLPDGDRPAQVTAIETGGVPVAEAAAGESAALLVAGAGERLAGGVLAAPGGLVLGRRLTAAIEPPAHRGGVRPVRPAARVALHARTARVPGTLHLGQRPVAPGAPGSARVLLDAPVPLHAGLRFVLRTGGRTLAAGTVRDFAPLPGQECPSAPAQ
ncbi:MULTISPECIES: GTP-binding protein [unclassified Streptomyces]|uniref:GTP-binding protein n=1 Tax=unclassified Streptomyces TaxID=2593676 RepID=UPI00068C893E|nr:MULTISPECIES: GTP-binding protein [unclassified Streptomyces]QHF94853.1 elongation factor Tu [Streptomyces sp. NHF165]